MTIKFPHAVTIAVESPDFADVTVMSNATARGAFDPERALYFGVGPGFNYVIFSMENTEKLALALLDHIVYFRERKSSEENLPQLQQ